MPGTDTILELDKLSAGYDRSPVVRDLTLTVRSGEVVALLGANGAGKTTTLRAVSGLLKHGSGAVKLAGTDLSGVSATARAQLGIAHVPSDRGLFFGLTVAEHFRLDAVIAADIDGAFAHFPALHDLKDRRAGLLPRRRRGLTPAGLLAVSGKPWVSRGRSCVGNDLAVPHCQLHGTALTPGTPTARRGWGPPVTGRR